MGIKRNIKTKFKNILMKSENRRKRQEQPIDVEFVDGGVWHAYKNIDMCGQGDVEIIGGWKQKHSIEELKRMVIKKGYSAFTVSSGEPSFGHAALKKFNFNVTPLTCKPITTCCHHPCTIYIYNSFGSSDKKSSAIGKQLKLVKRGSPEQCIFKEINLLKAGMNASSELTSHGG